jgi:hypothetical protein
MELYAFALLPFALLSAWLHRNENHRSTAGFGFLAALAPVLASGVSKLISHKQGQSAAKQQEEQRKLQAQQQDALAKQQWEADQNSGAAQTGRFKNTFALGKLAGKMGGSLDKVPPSIAKYYNSMRTMPEYSAQSSYVPTAKKGGGFWDFAGGLTDALSYLDTSKLGGGKQPMGQTPPLVGNGLPPVETPNFSGGTGTPLSMLTERLKSGFAQNPYAKG